MNQLRESSKLLYKMNDEECQKTFFLRLVNPGLKQLEAAQGYQLKNQP